MRYDVPKVCTMLEKGGVVALPTETVYGLAASIKFPHAIDQIFALKKRPSDNPLILHVASFEQAKQYCAEVPSGVQVLEETFWPGPLTLVLKAKPGLVPENATAGLDSIAFRVPNHPLTLQVLEAAGPLVMPSANLSGKPSATRAEHVEADFGEAFPVLDGGACRFGMESTVLVFRNARWEIARMGAISSEEFVHVLGYEPKERLGTNGSPPISPGQKYRHYAPFALLILDRTVLPEDVGVVIGFNDRKYPESCRLFSLGSSGDAREVSRNLYHVLRELDMRNVAQAWVDMDFPKAGLWLTVAERLSKASQKM